MIVRKVGLLRFYFSEPDADRGVLSLLKPVYFVFFAIECYFFLYRSSSVVQ